MTQPGIPNGYALSTTCYGARLRTIGDQAFAAVAMGFRRLEIGVCEQPVPLNGFEDSRRETGITVGSVVAGCLDSTSEKKTGSRLASMDEDMRERALNSVRRHVRLAHQCGCNTIIVRGCEVEDPVLADEGRALRARILREGVSEELTEVAQEFVQRMQKKSHRQIEHLCRALHALLAEFPESRFAIEPGLRGVDLIHHQTLGWILDDLASPALGYWHDTGHAHQSERIGLPGQGAWLDTYAPRMFGVHLQDSIGDEVELPPGVGEIDFPLVAGYVPRSAERVLEIKPSHGRAEILSAVQFLVDLGL